MSATDQTYSEIAFRTMRLLLFGLALDLALSVLLVVLHAAYGYTSILSTFPFFGASIALLSASSIIFAAAYCYYEYPKRRTALLFIVFLTAIVLALHLATISSPPTTSISDEGAYYAPAANNMLNGIKSNLEHPPLSKAFIAVGMEALGTTCNVNSCSPADGARILPVILGTACIPLLFAVAWKLSKDKRVAYFAALMLAMDTMFFVFSGSGFLDVPPVFFALAALVVYIYKIRFFIFDSFYVAGALLGLAFLCKETSIVFILALVTFHILRGRESYSRRLISSSKIIVVAVLVFIIGLQFYDSLLVGGSPPTPYFTSQISYILSYGSSLTCKTFDCSGAWQNPDGTTITPLTWLVYYVPTLLYGVCVNNVCGGPPPAYWDVTNMVETLTVWIWVPFTTFILYRLLRGKSPPNYSSIEEETTQLTASRGYSLSSNKTSGVTGGGSWGFHEVDLAVLALVFFAWGYFPFVGLALLGRVTYPFYILPAVPPIALGAAYLLTRSFVPKWVAIIFLVFVAVWFFVYFPDKGSLSQLTSVVAW